MAKTAAHSEVMISLFYLERKYKCILLRGSMLLPMITFFGGGGGGGEGRGGGFCVWSCFC